ncbi:helix-turn-helix domain-containing protein [Streptomyces sp. NPDC058457]|uniref:helix-turn-helix domain-containing protein n=1 Tax=Streptomyces sp. NPDC058457 TaxID=3346507 RepID=UPI00364E3D23
MHALLEDHTGVRMARLRRERHLTQRAAAELAGIPYSTYTKTEQGVIAATPHVIVAFPAACGSRSPRLSASPTRMSCGLTNSTS